MKKQLALLLAPALAPLPPAAAQTKPADREDDDVRLNVDLVRVDVTVKGGRPAADRRAEDFELLEDGGPRLAFQMRLFRDGRGAVARLRA